MTNFVKDQVIQEHEKTMHDGSMQRSPILPNPGSVIQSGAFGAALGGMSAGVMEMARVKNGEISPDEAIRNVAKNSAQSAATMAVATVAAQIVRSRPIFGFIALAAAGVGAFIILSNAGANTGLVKTADVPERVKKPAARKPKSSVRRTTAKKTR